MKTLTVLVPAFNEENTISESLDRLKNISIITEILVLDDGSTDNTKQLVRDVALNNNKIKLKHFHTNNGKGAVLNKSREFITSDYVVIHDADLEYFPEDIEEMFKEVNGDNLILGSRFIGNKKRINLYSRTYLANKAMSLFFSIVNFTKITDVATCYKMMPSDFFKSSSFTEKGFSIEIEMLSRFLKTSNQIIEVPISYKGRSYKEGKKIKLQDGFLYLINTVKYRIIS
jgi:glycosyltransferase involved in cell wall biosynthesis|tara:strand:+ start:6311 stop:6997 length:687 start_codon:yes stop_codon:yes gene_type:complete